MATNPTAGYIYFVESESVGGDDWITDHAGDPDLMDLDLMTEGTEYCKLPLPRRWVKNFDTGMTFLNSGGGKTFQLRPVKRFYNLLGEGIETSRSNGDIVEGFFTIERHTASSSTTYKDYYMVIYFGVNDHVLFTDDGGTRRSYCKGAVSKGAVLWEESTPLNVTVRLTFNSIWN